MKSFQLQKETEPTTGGKRVRAAVLWVLLGAIAGFIAYYPLAILMAGSTKTVIGTFEDWTLPAFVPLASFACAAIPLAAIVRVSKEPAERWPQSLSRSTIVAIIAFPLSSVLAIVSFGVVRSSWQYAHDGVADWFLLSIPALTGVGLLFRDS